MTSWSRSRRSGNGETRSWRSPVVGVPGRCGSSDPVVVVRRSPNSDVDFLVEFEPGRSLLDQAHMIDELGLLLGTRVDFVAKSGLLDRDNHILAEAIPL